MQHFRTNPPSRTIEPRSPLIPSERHLHRAPRVVQAHTNMAAASAAMSARIGGAK